MEKKVKSLYAGILVTVAGKFTADSIRVFKCNVVKSAAVKCTAVRKTAVRHNGNRVD